MHWVVIAIDASGFAIIDRILKFANDVHPYIHVIRCLLCNLHSGSIIASTADAGFVERGHDPLVSIISHTKVSLGAITVDGVSIGAPTGVKNAYRTLAGFSTAAEKKMTGQVYFDIYKAYFGVGDYAHQRVMAALDKTGICSACDDAARVQSTKKTSAYMNVWMYVIREFEDAIEDCNEGCIDRNDDPVHAWDEVWPSTQGRLRVLTTPIQ
jgi:hypothetical protein